MIYIIITTKVVNLLSLFNRKMSTKRSRYDLSVNVRKYAQMILMTNFNIENQFRAK